MKQTVKILISLSLLTFLFADCQKKEKQVFKRTNIAMGTIVQIQIEAFNENEIENTLSKAFNEIERISRKYSTYIDSNYLDIINKSETEEIIIDEETYFILQRCSELTELTNGAFDASIGNLVDAFGFETKNPLLPSKKEIENAKNKSGWNKIKLLDNFKIYKEKSVQFNFSAAVKGYAVDRASKIIEEAGFKTYLINAGGELYGSGREWIAGIQHPRIRGNLIGKAAVKGIGLATSGDYEQFFEISGKRYTHIIDPATGYPSDKSQSVTVIAEDVLTADALATGIFVLGAEKGIKILNELPNIEGMIIDNSGKQFFSAGFEKYLRR
ncbi:MAG: FAD:protein FMN transferase [Ignavibacteriae bacterium]|nr:FAD:protein FMN transferase [Ignavibacteriota bacterium]NOG99958.1 FAD:protein FMN transferase [Ignavibacteriota bacterium]